MSVYTSCSSVEQFPFFMSSSENNLFEIYVPRSNNFARLIQSRRQTIITTGVSVDHFQIRPNAYNCYI